MKASQNLSHKSGLHTIKAGRELRVSESCVSSKLPSWILLLLPFHLPHDSFKKIPSGAIMT